VILKWAQSLDGKIATHTGDSKWISDARARRHAHGVRGRLDAIVVGANTVLTDDPMLTSRISRPRRVATRVVLDRRLKTPLESRLVQSAVQAPVLIYCAKDAPPRKRKAIAKAGLRDDWNRLACRRAARSGPPRLYERAGGGRRDCSGQLLGRWLCGRSALLSDAAADWRQRGNQRIRRQGGNSHCRCVTANTRQAAYTRFRLVCASTRHRSRFIVRRLIAIKRYLRIGNIFLINSANPAPCLAPVNPRQISYK
jgi:hypothetical protein